MTKIAFWFWAVMAMVLACGLAIYFWPHSEVHSAEAAILAPTTLPTATATSVPATATPPPLRYPAGSQIGTVAVGGLTTDEARAALRLAYAGDLAPLTLSSPGGSYIIKASAISLSLPLEAALREADAALPNTSAPIRLDFAPAYDLAQLRDVVASLAAQVALSPTLGYDAKAATFVLTPGLALDVDGTLAQITDTLETASASRHITLVTTPVTDSLQASPDELIAALAAREKRWGGVIGVSLYNIQTNQRIHYHGDTVFSGVSVVKIPILLQAYISRAEFSKGQRGAIKLMIEKSDNESANELLAMIGEGDGLLGTRRMNATLADVLGIEFTTLAAPFESITYLSKFEGVTIPKRGQEGEAPFTDADPYLRATPNEMTRIVTAIVRCANGEGPLLDMAETALTPVRCDEMLEVMAQNEDINKIVAGVPKDAFVAHKSGWADDVRADSGYVHTAAGDEYVVSMWIWDSVEYIDTEVSDPLLADISRIVYTAQHPVIIER
jgi:beta-lactamase class A